MPHVRLISRVLKLVIYPVHEDSEIPQTEHFPSIRLQHFQVDQIHNGCNSKLHVEAPHDTIGSCKHPSGQVLKLQGLKKRKSSTGVLLITEQKQ
ncbi:unnamed protein product [Linum trigynum]|uniref:Uncharacterized protein n=1 Tax=Linum trigynum TaxID=586398 RepID=A0AAV2G3P3_9ROSI